MRDASSVAAPVKTIGTFETEFDAIWQVFLRGDYAHGLESLERLRKRSSERLGPAAPMTSKILGVEPRNGQESGHRTPAVAVAACG